MVTNSNHPDIFEGVNSIPELISARAKMTPDDNGLVDQQTSNNWKWTSWGKFNHYIEQTARQLHSHGCQSGDAIAIMASSSIYWDLIQYAILKNGGIVVGIDVHDTANNIQAILDSVNIKGIITDDSENLAKINIPSRKKMLFVLEAMPTEHLDNFQFLTLNDKPVTKKYSDLSDWPKIDGDDTATIIFTSGTTGKPKGIPYTHKQILIACKALTKTYSDVTDVAELVCWLPLSNLFQRVMNYSAVAVGAKTHYVSDPKEVLNYLPEISPTVFIAVPRFYEKLYEGIQNKINQAPLPAKLLFSLSHKMNCWVDNTTNKGSIAIIVKKITAALVFNKLKKQLFGSNLKYVISGSAPMPSWLLGWFQAVGVLILEAYGVSENIVPIACNTPQNYKFGTVGKPVLPNRVRLSKHNEIEVSGPGVFTNYLADVIEQKSLTPDGYLQTGDEGMIDDEGFIVLNGRTSDFFKTSTGRRISPLGIEKRLNKCRDLDHVIIIGEGRKVPIACATISSTDRTSEDTAFFDALRSDINGMMSQDIPDYQKPAAILLFLSEFTVSGGEVTANLKLRKKLIMDKYRKEIDRSYEILQKTSGKTFYQQVSDKSILVIL
jgi:long-chain acyl-CoA synthetase